MSTPSPKSSAARGGQHLPEGVVLGSYERYQDAQQDVDRLIHAELPAKTISIIGSGLKSVERVVGRRSYGRAAATGASTGIWIGLFVALSQLIFAPDELPSTFVLATVLVAGGIGMIFGVVSHAVTRRGRSFMSVTHTVASSYELLVAPEQAVKARKALEGDSSDAAAEAKP